MRLVPCLLASWLAIAVAAAQQQPPSDQTSDPSPGHASAAPSGNAPSLVRCMVEEPAPPPPPPESAPVPEPSTLLLVGTGLVKKRLNAIPPDEHKGNEK